MSEKDLVILKLLLETVSKIFKFTEDLKSASEFENDEESFDAVIMNFIVLGENTTKLSEDFKKQNSEINWRKIYAFRNVLAHDYFGILAEEVWEIIKKDIPILNKQIVEILETLES